ncbi:MAG: histidinol dehydrogenase [Deltaproteobacteria bacterium]|uniref:Histidinol dehydrogenase n=1 Tax=Desulforhabdus amnigena TaxID=40218 RepID=A0A9W6L9A1_9BACT|nr:histidinol dehydrogenase [Desulforhabdus amnigena]NLJ27124.1 histidinol dehydrogenase [Deltaproteobacteria bacterium]GLI36403.1 histidinol dehydrogenase [Desulforhabdus amnigena]
MLKAIPYPSQEAEEKLAHIATRKMGADPSLEKRVFEILETVKREGDAAVIRFTRQFDAPSLGEDRLTVREEEIRAAYDEVDTNFLDILRTAIANIEAFHRQQLHPSHFMTKPDGTFMGQMVRPVSAAGLYIPGGKGGETPLISSVLMNGIPARLAGVKDLALATPPRKDGTINPYLLVAAKEVGVTRIHKMGSAWGIAALAYGTASVQRVDVVVGPGNIYVALAKKLVSGEVGIDLLAGPSEILVIADAHARPDYIAADLLSQAEHDPLASAVLISTDRALAEKVTDSVRDQLKRLPRCDIATEALERYGALFLVKDVEDAIRLSNRIAPEHLELQLRDPWSHLGKIEHAGAVFLGDATPEAVGDYFAGPNHVLPTAGTARFASALGVENFLKRTSVISYSKTALERDGRAIIRMAELEGLGAHAASVRIRLEG